MKKHSKKERKLKTQVKFIRLYIRWICYQPSENISNLTMSMECGNCIKMMFRLCKSLVNQKSLTFSNLNHWKTLSSINGNRLEEVIIYTELPIIFYMFLLLGGTRINVILMSISLTIMKTMDMLELLYFKTRITFHWYSLYAWYIPLPIHSYKQSMLDL